MIDSFWKRKNEREEKETVIANVKPEAETKDKHKPKIIYIA